LAAVDFVQLRSELKKNLVGSRRGNVPKCPIAADANAVVVGVLKAAKNISETAGSAFFHLSMHPTASDH